MLWIGGLAAAAIVATLVLPPTGALVVGMLALPVVMVAGLGPLGSLATDAFFLSDNDLVVPTRSMFGGALRHQPALFFLDESAQTHHFGYFGDTRCAEAIVAALLDEAPPQFRPIGPLSWAGDSPTGSR